jgi:peptidoglycan/LPS O-acetylase OafA/YrhL
MPTARADAADARDLLPARHIGALDGLRGLAVLGVLAFHGGYLTGGYLGVDLFFVLSGFLITGLLLREHGTTDRIDMKSFWQRRGRRLLPALFGVLVGVALYAWFVAAAYELPGIRADSLWTLLYMANWHAIWSGDGYWQLFNAPSPLEHTWSLAIEEQFYLVWPLVFYGLVKVARGRHGVIAAVCGAGAALSAGWALVLFARTGDASRVYLGTDTRAAAILAGSCLAAVLVWRGPVRSAQARTALEVVAVVAAIALAVAWIWLPGESPVLYRGVLPLCGLAVVALIAAASHPTPGVVSRALSSRGLRWVGLISYGLYLWHWPVFVWFRRERIFDGGVRFAAELAVSFALAIASYYVIERPIRFGGIASWPRPALVPLAAVGVVVLLFVATLGGVERGQPEVAAGAGPTGGAAGSPVVQAPLPPPPSTLGSGSEVPSTVAVAGSGPVVRPVGRPARLLVVGDSVAWFVARSLDRHATQDDLVVGQRAAPSCAFYNGDTLESRYEGKVTKEDPKCEPWREGLRGDAQTFRPDATLLLFGGAVFGQRQVHGAWRGFCDAEYQAAYRRTIDRSLDALTSTGAPVFLALAPQQLFPFLPEESARFNECLNQGLIEAAAARPSQARIVRLDEWTCPPGQPCREEVDGVKLREDGIHFDEGGGAEIVSPWLLAQVFTPKR